MKTHAQRLIGYVFRFVAAVVIGYLLLAIVAPLAVNSQMRHLKETREYLDSVRMDWAKFQGQHRELHDLELFPYTGGDGMVGIAGVVTNDASILLASNFVAQTKPPRPIYLGAIRFTDVDDPKFIEGANKNPGTAKEK